MTADAVAVAKALRWLAGTETLAREMAVAGIPVMVLKGPHVQRRLLGTPAAYHSADIDLLVPRTLGRKARKELSAVGWEFGAVNGALWRLDGAAAYSRDGVVVDLHWGVHVGLLPARALRTLEGGLWHGAEEVAPNLFQPRIEPLCAYLALHMTRTLTRDDKLSLLRAAAAAVSDWDEVWRLTTRALQPAAAHAIAVAQSHATPEEHDLVRARYGALSARLIHATRAGRWRRLLPR